MKKLLLPILMLLGIYSFGQTTKHFNSLTAYAGLPYGVGVEVGHVKQFSISNTKFDYFLGFSSDFGNQTSNGNDLTFYGKGLYSVDRIFGITGMAGIQDFNELVLGLGFRATLPADKYKIVLEPMWRTNGSRVNVGFQFKL